MGLDQIPLNLSPAYTDPISYLSGSRLASQHGEIRAGPQTSFAGYQLPERGQGQTNFRLVANPYSKDPRVIDQTKLSGLVADVPHWTIDSYRKTCLPWSTQYAGHTVPSEKQLEGPGVTGIGHTSSQVASEMVAV